MMLRSRFRYLAIISLLVLIGFHVRAASLDAQSLWRDEVDALRFATAPWSEMLGNFTRPGWNGPLYYVLLRAWITATGTSEYAMRFLSLVFGILSIPLTFLVGHRLFDPKVGAVSALLVSTSPYLTWYSQEVKMYTLVLTLSLLSIYSLRRALEGGGRGWWGIQILTTSLAFYSHILAALLVPLQILFSLVWWPRARERWRGALVSLACLTLPYLPLAVWQAPLALQVRDTGFFPYTLRQMIVILLNGWSGGIRGWGGSWAAAFMALLAAVGLVNSAVSMLRSGDADEQPLRGQTLRSGLVLLIWLSFPLLCVWLVSLRQPLFTDRYLIWSASAFYLLVALALTSFVVHERVGRWISVPLIGAILILNGANLWEQAAIPIKSDFRAAAAYVIDHPATSADANQVVSAEQPVHSIYLPITRGTPSAFDELIIFQIPYAKHTFDYYFPVESYPHAEGLYTNHRAATGEYLMSEEQAARQMRIMTRGHRAVWLVASEVPMWDERNLVQHWLDQNGQRTAEAHFNRVDVYRYELADR